MARCQCAGSSCSCLIIAGDGVQISGTGTADRPYVVSANPNYYAYTYPTSGTTVFAIGSQGYEVGSRAVYRIEGPPGPSFSIRLPDGGNGTTAPSPGAQYDVFVNVSAGAAITWQAGIVVLWYTTPAPGSKLGWYRFIHLGDIIAASFVGP